MSVISNENHFVFKSLLTDKTEQAIRNSLKQRSLYLSIKRVFDVLISSLVIIFFLSWLLPLLAILIKLDSRGPVFFIQKRIGFLGKSFLCLKLRTMVVNPQCDHQQA